MCQKSAKEVQRIVKILSLKKRTTMKKTIFTTFQILIGLVLLAKISNWFLEYSDETNQLINTAMFSLIGIAYIVVGFLWDKKWSKLIFIVCGLYLLGMYFLNDSSIKSIISIVCLITPLLIARFTSQNEKDKDLAQN